MYKWSVLAWALAVSFVLGVLARAVFDLTWSLPVFGFGFLLLIYLASWCLVRIRPLRRWLAYLLLLMTVVVGGFWRSDAVFRRAFGAWDERLGQTVEFTAAVAAEPDERLDHQRLTLQPLGEKFKILIVAGREPKFAYGDRLSVRGELAEPANFLTDTGREFDYIGYLAKDDIYYLIYRPELQLLAGGEGQWLLARLLALKHWFVANLERRLPEPYAALAAGLTVGARRGLSSDWLTLLRRAGVIHIIVLSGYNLTIVAETLMRLLAFLPHWWRLGGGAAGIILFALLAGSGASVIRATLMALIALLARLTGRVYHATTALGVAAVAMILLDPRILLFDVGFQLSVLATFGLIHGPRHVQKFFKWLPARWGFRELAAATAATQIFVLPWLLYKIGELSLVALPVNLLVVGAVPLTMLLIFLTGVLAPLGFLAWPFSAAAYLLLAYQLKVVAWFNLLPGAAVLVPSFPLALVALAYGLLFWWWFLYNRAS